MSPFLDVMMVIAITALPCNYMLTVFALTANSENCILINVCFHRNICYSVPIDKTND
jgi:hypothetical protein